MILLLTGCIGICLLARDHFILGSLLSLLLWVYVISVLAFLYFVFKWHASIGWKILLMGLIAALLVDYVAARMQKQSLKEGTFSNEVSLMTYNIFFKNSSPRSSIEIIKSYNPDILLVQELTPSLKEEIENAVGANYAYKKISALSGTHGIGVYSKYPIVKVELLQQSEGDHPYGQIIDLEVNGITMLLANVHLASPAIAVENPGNFLNLFRSNYERRRWQLDTINNIMNRKKDLVQVQLMVGDLNTTHYEPIYRDLTKNWVDLFDVTKNDGRLNFPHSGNLPPMLTLDYILGRGKLKGIEMKVMSGGSSDHLAVTGRIKI